MKVLSKQFLIILILTINTLLHAPRPEFEKYDFEKAKEETRKTELKADEKRAAAFDIALRSGDLQKVLKETDKFTVDDWLTSLGKQSTLLQEAAIKNSFIANLEKTGKTEADYQKLTDHFDTWSKTLSETEKLDALDKITKALNAARQDTHTKAYVFTANAITKIPAFYEQIALATKLIATIPEPFKNFNSDQLRQTIKSLNIALKKENIDTFFSKTNDLNTLTILAKSLPDLADSAITRSTKAPGSKTEKEDLQNEFQKLLQTLFEQFPTTQSTFNPNNASGLAMLASARTLEKLFDNPALKITDKNLEKTVDQFISGIKQMGNNPGFDFLAFRFYMITEPQKLVEQLKGMSSKGREFALDSFAKNIKETSDPQTRTTLIKQLSEFITAITPKLLIYDPAQGTSHLALLALLDNHIGTIAPDVHTTIVTLQKNAIADFIKKVPTSKKLTEENFITGAQNIIKTIEYMVTKSTLSLNEASKQIREVLTLAQKQGFLTELTQDRVLTDTLKNLLKQANSLKNTAQSQYLSSLISYVEKQASAPIVNSIKTGSFDSSQLNQTSPSMVRVLLESLTNTLATETITQAQRANITTAAKVLLEATLRNFTTQEAQEFDDAFIAFFDKATEQITIKDAQELLQASFTTNNKAPLEQLKIPELRLKLLLRASENIKQLDKDQLVKILVDAWPIAQNNDAARNAFLFLLDKINWNNLQENQIKALAPIAVDAARFRKFDAGLASLKALKESINQQLLQTISTTILDMLNTHPEFLSSPLDALRLTELKTVATTSLNTGIDAIIERTGKMMQNDKTSLNDLSKALKEAAKNPANQDALVLFISNMFTSKPDFAKSTDTSDPNNARKKRSFLETLKTGSEAWDKRMEALKPTSLSLMWVETRLKDPKQIQTAKPKDFEDLLTSMNDILSAGTEKGLIDSILQSSPTIFEKAARFETSQTTAPLAEQFVTFAKTIAMQKPDLMTSNVIPALTTAVAKMPTLANDAGTIMSAYISAKKAPFTENEIKSITTLTKIVAQQTPSVATTLTQQIIKTFKSPKDQINILKQASLPAKEAAETFTQVLENQNLSNTDLLEIARSENLNEAQLKTVSDRLTKAINDATDIETLKAVSEKNPSLKSAITTQLLDIATRKNTTTQNTINIIKEALSKDLTPNQIDKLITALARPEILALPNILETVITVYEKKVTAEQKDHLIKTAILPLYDKIDRNDFSAIMKANELAMRLNNKDIAAKQLQLFTDYVANTSKLPADQINKLIVNSSLLDNESTIIKAIADHALKNNWNAGDLITNITDKQTRTNVINQMLDQASGIEALDIAKTLGLLDNVITNKDLTFDTTKFNAVLARTLSDPRSINIMLKTADKVTPDQVDNFIKQIINPLYEIAAKKLDYQTIEQLGLLAVKPQFTKTVNQYMQLVSDFIKRNASSLGSEQVEEFATTSQLLNASDKLSNILASTAFETPTLLNKIEQKTASNIIDKIITTKIVQGTNIKDITAISDFGSKISAQTSDAIKTIIWEKINNFINNNSTILSREQITRFLRLAQAINRESALIASLANAVLRIPSLIGNMETDVQNAVIKNISDQAIKEKWSLEQVITRLNIIPEAQARVLAELISTMEIKGVDFINNLLRITQGLKNRVANPKAKAALTDRQLFILNKLTAKDFETMSEDNAITINERLSELMPEINQLQDFKAPFDLSVAILGRIITATKMRLEELEYQKKHPWLYSLQNSFWSFLAKSFDYSKLDKTANKATLLRYANEVSKYITENMREFADPDPAVQTKEEKMFNEILGNIVLLQKKLSA